MEKRWWMLPQMSQTIVRARERTYTFLTMVENNLPPDCEEYRLAKEMYELATKLFILINTRIIEEDEANAR